MPISEVRVRTLAVRFQHWDRDANGYIDRSDLEDSARRVGEAFGQAADSPEHLALTTSCRQLWQTLAQHADVDLDGRISQDEYVSAFSSEVMAEADAFDRVYRALLQDVVNLADADGDGKLNEEEYLRLMRSWYNAEDSDAAAAFRRLDRDGDGFLSHEELIRSATDFYLSDDPFLQPPPPRR
ncbi:MAG: calcium-binding protein [Streptosporangiaceae bacterium]|jgi:Ca2+-binding EF-hand superfamily protein|nr:calcium-binding protein [Streptosporangiaceae bacterium]